MSRAIGVALTAIDLRSLSMAFLLVDPLSAVDVDEPLPGRARAGEFAEEDGFRGGGGDSVVVHDEGVVAGLRRGAGEGELPLALAIDFDEPDGAEGAEGVAEGAVGACGVVERLPGDPLGAEAGDVGSGYGEAVGICAGDGIEVDAGTPLHGKRKELRLMDRVHAMDVCG